MGMIRQGPIVAVQAVSSKDQLAVATSLVTFCLALGAALFISFGQTAFANALKSGLKKFAPEVDVSDVLNAGSTNFKSVIDQASIPGVIQAYNNALTTAFVCTRFSNFHIFPLTLSSTWLLVPLVSPLSRPLDSSGLI